MLLVGGAILVDGSRTVPLAGKQFWLQGGTNKAVYWGEGKGRIPEDTCSLGQSAGKIEHSADGDPRPGGKIRVNFNLVGATS